MNSLDVWKHWVSDPVFRQKIYDSTKPLRGGDIYRPPRCQTSVAHFGVHIDAATRRRIDAYRRAHDMRMKDFIEAVLSLGKETGLVPAKYAIPESAKLNARIGIAHYQWLCETAFKYKVSKAGVFAECVKRFFSYNA